MAVTITYHGHACFSIQTGDTYLLTDPFITGNSMADVTAEQVRADYILISHHAHGDHLGDAVPIARRTGAMVISNFEIAGYMAKHNVKAHEMHIGGAHLFPFGKLKLTIAHHGSSFPDGSYGGNPCGFLLWLEDKVIYFAGDTALFSDMKLYADANLDVAILPCGDNYTMGPEDAVRAVEFLRPKFTILMHYDTWPVIAQDVESVAESCSAQTQVPVILLRPGEATTL
jgi:L-ascorbate metabolism protein UlaG (beta-lactamase superfamily)